jgi:hypothetical protein
MLARTKQSAAMRRRLHVSNLADIGRCLAL